MIIAEVENAIVFDLEFPVIIGVWFKFVLFVFEMNDVVSKAADDSFDLFCLPLVTISDPRP